MKMHDDNEDMERFIAEQRRRLKHDRETLERNPPSTVADYIVNGTEPERPQNDLKKNIRKEAINPPQQMVTSVKTKPPTPQLFKLGEAYKLQKEKLKEELREDYRRTLAEKQVRTTGVRGEMQTKYEEDLSLTKQRENSDLGLSLPIRDHLSAKERLRLERNREYNEFKANKENDEKLKSPRRATTYPPPDPPVVHPAAPVTETTQTIAQNDVKPQARESYQELLDRKRQEEKAYRNTGINDNVVYREKPPRRYVDDGGDLYVQRRVIVPKKQRPRYVERYYDEFDDDDDVETEEELIRRLRARRQRKRISQRFVDSDNDDDDDEALFERVHPKKMQARDRQPRLGSAENAPNRSNPYVDPQNDLRSKSAPPEEFTGLPVGTVTSANTVQRRKDEYKRDLQKQMEENERKKKITKQLDREADVAADKRKNTLRRSETNAVNDDAPIRSKKKAKKKTTFMTEGSEGSESDDDRRRRPPRQRYPGYYGPPPPPALNGYYPQPPLQYPSPYDDAYYYYGTRNPLDPAALPPGSLNIPLASHPPGVSPLLAAADSKSYAPQLSNYPEVSNVSEKRSSLRASNLGNVQSNLVSDDSRDALKKREMMQAYQEELKEQMTLKEKKKQKEKWEQEQYDRRIEQEAMNYNPWGKGGGGAPMKDVHGNLVSDLRQMHLQNEDLVRDPTKVAELAKQRQQMIENTEEMFQSSRKQDALTDHLSPRFGRSNPFEVKETVEQRSQKDVYKDELQKQIEQRRQIEAERKEKLRLIEEKEERRMQEENRKMQEEYENEQRKQREKIEEKQRQNEELRRALEEKRLEEERKRKEEQMKREEEERQAKDRELQEKLKATTSKPKASAVKAKETPRVVHTDRSTARREAPPKQQPPPKQPVTEKSYHRVVQEQPEPVIYERAPSTYRENRSRESKRISRELSALRKQLLSEQQRIETQIRSSDTLQFNTYQPNRLKTENLIDLSRVRQRPVHVRRPPTVERPDSKVLREFTDFKHKQDDTTSLRMFRIQHPDTPSDVSSLEKQQEEMIKTQLMKIETLRNGTVDQPHYSRRSPTKSSRNGFSLLPPSHSSASLLETETTYIPVDDVENRPPVSSPRRERKSSARERRRIKRHEDEGGLTYRAAADNYSLNSLNSLATLDVERLANKNQERLEKLKVLQGDEVSLTDPDDILDRFVNQQKTADLPDTPDTYAPNPRRPRKGTSISAPQPERPSSVNTVDTELWLRPGTTGPPATAS